MDAPTDVRKKQGWLKEEAKKTRVTLRTHDSEGSWLEGVFARGDRRLGRVIEHAWRAGARFDSWDEHLELDRWNEAMAAAGLEPAMFLGTIPVTARLPWDHIDVGLEEGFLAREYRKALKSRLSPPCGKIAGQFVHATNLVDAGKETKKLVCYDCGVACDLGAMREERLVYLRKLGADEPRVRKAPPAPEPGTTDAPPKPQREKPPAAFEQGEPRRYRFAYTKRGPSALLSHLDLIRALPRAFRRVDVPLFYTQGFHPKPDMSFGPALTLGTSSLAEIVDIKITADVDPSALLGALSEGAPRGLDFVGGVRLGPQDAAITKVATAARYVIAFARSALRARGGEAWLEQRVRAFMEATELKQLRVIEGIGKWVDVRSFVREMCMGSADDARAIEAAGLVGDFALVAVDVRIRHDGAVRLEEIVRALSESPANEIEHYAVRTALGTLHEGRILSPLDLDVVRAALRSERRDEAATAQTEVAAG